MTESQSQPKRIAVLNGLIVAVSVALCAFQLYTAATVPLTAMVQRGVHLAFICVLVFLYAAKAQKHLIIRIIYYIAAISGFVVNIYIAHEWLGLQSRTMNPTVWDILFGVIAVAVIFFATYKTCGIWLPVITSVFIVYAIIGPYLGGILHYGGITVRRFFAQVYFGTNGIYGTCLAAAATFAFMFVLYADFMQTLGGGDFIIDLAQAVLGKVRGGPAKMAVMASCLFGTISGSAVANVTGTGCLTIPLMKRTGFKSEYAGAVESVASTGGQLVPPVMGAAAFVMAEMTGIPYATICLAALPVAFFFYMVLLISVDMRAAKDGLKGMSKEELPKLSEVMKKGWYYLASLITLVFLLCVLRWSTVKAGFWSIVALVIVDFLAKIARKEKYNPKILVDAMVSGCKSALTVSTACACAGVLVGVLSATSLTLRLADIMVAFAGGNLFLLLIMTMICAIILGMGLPTVSVYVVLGVMIAPALVKLNVPVLTAHLYVFYYGIMAAVTPPVGMAFYVASGIAECKPMACGWRSVRLAVAALILPFIMVYEPAILLQGDNYAYIAWVLLYTAIAMIGLAAGMEGYIFGNVNVPLRVILIVGSVLTIFPELITTIIGVIAVLAVFVIQFIGQRRQAKPKLA